MFSSIKASVRLFFLLILLSVPVLAIAQDRATINGYITESATGEAIWGANIIIEGTTTGTSSNSSGFYTLSRIQPGTYTLVFSFIGFQELKKEITVESGQTVQIDAQLVEENLSLDEVTVTSDSIEREERQNIGVATVPTQLIRDIPAVLQADVFRSIQLLPGIKAASDFSSGLYIRGGSPDQTLILLDNTTVYNPTHFFGFFSTFNPDAIRDVRIYKGGFPSEYGGRIGSVLDIYNKDGNRFETKGTASVGLLSSRASVEGPYKYGSYMFAVRRSTLEPLLWSLKGTVDNIPESFYFYDFNGKVNIDLSPKDRFSVSMYSGMDDVLFPASDDLILNLNYGNLTGSTTWRRILSNELFSTITVTGSRYFNFPKFEFGGTEFERSNTVNDFSVKADIEWSPGQNHTVKSGIWAGNILLRLSETFDGLETQSPRIESQYITGYIQDKWKITNRWIVNAGIRSSYYTNGGYTTFEPRLQLEYRPNSTLRFQTAGGRYYQYLTLLTNEAFSGFDTWLLTDEGVPPAFGDQLVAGVKWNPKRAYNFEFELFYRNMKRLFEIDPRIPDTAGLEYNELFRFGEGFAYGAEILLEKTSGKVNGFIGYTWGTTRRKFPEFNQNRFYPPKYDRIHDINVVVNYNFARKWMMTAVFNFATGQTYTEPLGRTQIENPFGSTPENPITVGRVNASRLPDYHRLDIGFTYYSRFFNLGDSELQLQLINVYSRRNIWFYQFDFDQNPVNRQDVRMLPILPSITYTVNF